MRPNLIQARVLLLLLAAVAGCKSQPQGGLPTITLKMGDKTFTLEVADTDETRQYGLMRRDSMPRDHGMIFVFAECQPLSFYMRNTRIPLDIVYLDSAGKVVSIKQMAPYDETGIPSDGPAQFAVELNKGVAQEAGLRPGMVVQLPAGLKARE